MVTSHYTIPSPKGVIYAPILIAQTVAEGLNKLGHEVTFFAPKGSKIKVSRLVTGGLESLKAPTNRIFKEPYGRGMERGKIANLWDQYLISLMYQGALKGKYDILYIHPVDRALPFGMAIKEVPIVYTLHDPLFPWRAMVFQMFQTKNQHFVSISDFQRKPAPGLNWAGTVYNGLELKKFPFSKKPKNHYLFLGRLLPTKGVKEAIQAIKKIKEKLIIAGAPAEGEYWEKDIKPYLGKDIKYVGNVPYEKTYKYYGQAKALLCPIQWEEPFGLTFIEAMACSTPVIAFDRGSAKEVIKDGKTGFVVTPFNKQGKANIQGFAEAIKKVERIKRSDCRAWVEEKFTIEKMVKDYEQVFYQILLRVKKT